MAILIFFGFCFLVLTVSTVYVTVSIRHLLRKRKEAALAASAGFKEGQ